jgi:hypothetical protein
MEQKWIVFSYTLSAKKKSSARVALWRRLQKLGAVTPVGGVYVLPAREECVEALQWLAQEVSQAEGQTLVMRVDEFEGVEDRTIIELFQTARKEEYAEIDRQLLALETRLGADPSVDAIGSAQDELAKLKRRYAEIVRIDYFDSYERVTTAARLEKLTQLLFPAIYSPQVVPTAQIAEYQGRQWVTRPQPHVDRLACIWLIRRFIDADATIRYASKAEAGEIAFDMTDATFGHIGNLCTFETMIKAFQLEAKDLNALAEIVHEIDLRDERFVHPEAIGIDAILRGWLLENLADESLEQHGLALFDGIYQFLAMRV